MALARLFQEGGEVVARLIRIMMEAGPGVNRL
jgi:hypothetical protein